MPALPLTPEQKADAARLKSLLHNGQEETRARGELGSQDTLIELFGFGLSAVNHYLNGKVPIHSAATVKFSRVFKCQISNFSETIAAQASEISQTTTLVSDEPSTDFSLLDLTRLSHHEIQQVLAFRERSVAEQPDLLVATNKLRASAGASNPAKASGYDALLDRSYVAPVKKSRLESSESERRISSL